MQTQCLHYLLSHLNYLEPLSLYFKVFTVKLVGFRKFGKFYGIASNIVTKF